MSTTDPRSARTSWTESDFEMMNWHDCPVHGIAFVRGEQPWLHRLLFDIDYILSWIPARPPSLQLAFEIAPCTLTFEGVSAIDGNLEIDVRFPPRIDEIVRRGAESKLAVDLQDDDWAVVGHEFMLRLKANGFKQNLRAAPVVSMVQQLSGRTRSPINWADVYEDDALP